MIVADIFVGSIEEYRPKIRIDLCVDINQVDHAKVFVGDVVDDVLGFIALREMDKCSRAVGYVQKRSPLEAVAEYLHFVIKCAHKRKDVHDEIEAHPGRIAKQRAVSEDDGFPCRTGD